MHRVLLLLPMLGACTKAPEDPTGDDDDDAVEQAPDAEVAWSIALSPSRQPILRMGDLLYAMADAGGVTALDAATGEQRWFTPTDPIDVRFTYAKDGDFVLFPDGAIATYVVHETGEVAGTFRDDPVSVGMLMASTGPRHAVTYAQYQYDLGWAVQYDGSEWRSYIRHDVDSFTAPGRPVGDDLLLAGGSWLQLVRPTADSETQSDTVWRTDVGLSAGWEPVLTSEAYVVGGLDGGAAAVALDGALLWKKRGDWPLANEGISVDEDAGVVAVPMNNGDLEVLDLADGRLLWAEDLVGDIVGGATAARGRVYVATDDGTLRVFDATGGDEVAAVWVDAEWVTRPLLVDDTVVLGAADGTVYGLVEP